MPGLELATAPRGMEAAELRRPPASNPSVAEAMAQYKAKRYAIKYDPPTIILEYETPANERRLRSISLKMTEESNIEILTRKVIRSFPRRLDRKSVRFDQVERLVEKLMKANPNSKGGLGQPKRVAAQQPETLPPPVQIGSPVMVSRPLARNAADSFGMSVDSIADAEADLCKLSIEELDAVKASMDVDFKKHQIRKDDPNFKYDVQKEFNPTDDNDWDDDDEYEPSDGGSDEFEWRT